MNKFLSTIMMSSGKVKIILKVVEIQCFEMKSCVSESLLILCRLLKAGDTSLINDFQRKVYIFSNSVLSLLLGAIVLIGMKYEL